MNVDNQLGEIVERLRTLIRSSATHDERTNVVSTGHCFSDGESIDVLVRYSIDGTRVVASDGGATQARRSLFGIETFSRGARKLWDEILRDFGLETIEGRVFASGPSESAAELVSLLGDAAAALDSVRLLAEPTRVTFTEKLDRWLSDVEALKVASERVVTDRLGAVQKVTAIVEGPRGSVAVQGAGGRSIGALRTSAEHAYFIYSGLSDIEWPHDKRLIVLEHVPKERERFTSTAQSLVSRLTEQSYVGSFESQPSIRRFLTEEPEPVRDLVTQNFGQSRSFG